MAATAFIPAFWGRGLKAGSGRVLCVRAARPVVLGAPARIRAVARSASSAESAASTAAVPARKGEDRSRRSGWRVGARFLVVWLAVWARRLRRLRRGPVGRVGLAALGILALATVRGRVAPGLGGATATVAVPAVGRVGNFLGRWLPAGAQTLLRPFTEAFGVVFLSEFGDKSMFATALMAMKHNPLLVLVGALVSLTLMTLIACCLGQFMHLLPPRVTHYSTIALFAFFGLQMLLQARSLPNKPGGGGGERADAAEMVAAQSDKKGTVLAKICSLIFVAEWCDRSMLATMALAASSNTLAVVGGATVANIICTGFAVAGAALVSSKISERLVALVSGILFEFFAIFTFFEGPESS